MGTLIQKMARQSSQPIRVPPTIGPRPIEIPMTPPQTPIARARSRGSVNTLVMIDIATGFIIEPPIACRARNATSAPRLGATLQASDPTPNRDSPTMNTRLRPSRSAVEPDRMSRLASTNV